MQFVTLAERPDLIPAMWAMGNEWPPFMQQDLLSSVLWSRLPEVFPEWQQLWIDDDDQIIGKVHAIPFDWDGTDDGLPVRGWGQVQAMGFKAYDAGRTPTAVSLLEARFVPGHLATGASRTMLDAMADRVRAAGFLDLFGPVRPTQKQQHPLMSMDEYARSVRDDGLPVDPWLRVHARMAGRIVKVCPASMTVTGSLAQWREWTGLPFDTSGPVIVPFACNEVLVDVAQDYAVYVEPNVWVHHDLRSREG